MPNSNLQLVDELLQSEKTPFKTPLIDENESKAYRIRTVDDNYSFPSPIKLVLEKKQPSNKRQKTPNVGKNQGLKVINREADLEDSKFREMMVYMDEALERKKI